MKRVFPHLTLLILLAARPAAAHPASKGSAPGHGRRKWKGDALETVAVANGWGRAVAVGMVLALALLILILLRQRAWRRGAGEGSA